MIYELLIFPKLVNTHLVVWFFHCIFYCIVYFLCAYINMDVAQNVSTAGGLFQSLNFQKIVLIIAIIILIVSLVFIGMQIKKSNSKQVWPPIVPQCPDFWVVDATTGKCKPTANAPVSKCTTENPDGIDFTIGDYAGPNGACRKKQWANDCKKSATDNTPAPIAWEGITYGTADPCNNV
jgi:hypothetical protein